MQHQRGEKVIFAVSNSRPILSFPSQTCLEMSSIQSPPPPLGLDWDHQKQTAKRKKGETRRDTPEPRKTRFNLDESKSFFSQQKRSTPPHSCHQGIGMS